VISAGGIQLKNMQMAAHGRPMIARPQSLMGLPEPVKRLFTIAESPDAFANAILTELEARHTHKNNNLEVLAKYFGSESAMKIINDIKNLRE
jgi:predicted CopG family antitoxin